MRSATAHHRHSHVVLSSLPRRRLLSDLAQLITASVCSCHPPVELTRSFHLLEFRLHYYYRAGAGMFTEIDRTVCTFYFTLCLRRPLMRVCIFTTNSPSSSRRSEHADLDTTAQVFSTGASQIVTFTLDCEHIRLVKLWQIH